MARSVPFPGSCSISLSMRIALSCVNFDMASGNFRRGTELCGSRLYVFDSKWQSRVPIYSKQGSHFLVPATSIELFPMNRPGPTISVEVKMTPEQFRKRKVALISGKHACRGLYSTYLTVIPGISGQDGSYL